MCKERNGVMPKINDWLTMRDDKDGLYTTLMTIFTPCVVGVADYKRQVGSMFLSSFVTVGDEAFVLLTLENSEERWMELYKTGETKNKMANKYTDGGISRKSGRGRSLSGWSNAGLNRFNELYMKVKRDRDIPNRGFEGAFLDKMSAEYGTKRKRTFGQMESRVEDDQVVFVMDDMEAVPV